jgi:phage tail sheath protein FI
MPVTPTFPGVYIDEVASAVHTITGVPTSVAAFVGSAPRGPTDAPVHITSFADYQRIFGGIVATSPLSYAVYQFYLNGGSEAEVVRVVHTGDSDATKNATAATVALKAGAKTVTLTARGEGSWADTLRVRVDYATAGAANSYNLAIFDSTTKTVLERFRNVVADADDPNSLDRTLGGSTVLTVDPAAEDLNLRPDKHDDLPKNDPNDPHPDPWADNQKDKRWTGATAGQDGVTPVEGDYLGGSTGEADKKGIYQLLKTDIFTMLCLPEAPETQPLRDAAALLCRQRRSMFLVDPPTDWKSVQKAVDGMATPPLTGDLARNAAIYFPKLTTADPAASGSTRTVPPCGTLAGVWARTDVARGVWKAPAGTEASLNGVAGFTVPMGDGDNGRLNPLGVNCLRTFPVVGPVSWGARTLVGADRLGDQWKYLPVRRLALFLEESLFRGTQWVVFEPNDEPLWASIRLNVGAFMNTLFRQGAFQGSTAREAYLVKCDRENNPQNDIDRGIVNIVVGFAPLKPAEFVIIHIEQLAGQLQV